jgi:hypothetical protein
MNSMIRFANRRFLACQCCAVFLLVGNAGPLSAATISNVFDAALGQNTYLGGTPSFQGPGPNNWITARSDISTHSGSNFFASANGTTFATADIGLIKELGGTIEATAYHVSLFISKYEDGSPPLSGVPISDFLELKIGGNGGVMTWSSTPTPIQNGVWIPWTGVYTPSPADVGTQFLFKALWTSRPQTSIAFDGLMEATPVPEPGNIILLVAAIIMTNGLRMVADRRALPLPGSSRAPHPCRELA